MADVRDAVNEGFAFPFVKRPAWVVQLCQNLTKMLDMLVWHSRKYYDIVYINQVKLPFFLRKQAVHRTLKRLWGVLEAQWHSCKAE